MGTQKGGTIQPGLKWGLEDQEIFVRRTTTWVLFWKGDKNWTGLRWMRRMGVGRAGGAEGQSTHAAAWVKARRQEMGCFIWETANYLLWPTLKHWKIYIRLLTMVIFQVEGKGWITGRHLLSRYLEIAYSDQKLSGKKILKIWKT